VTADQRLINAAEYLGYAREVKVAELPHSAVVRLAAELRRQLGQVLDAARELTFVAEAAEDEEDAREATHVAIEGAVWLVAPDALTVLAALDDAAESLRDRIGYCRECGSTPLCEGCTGRLARADAYDALGRTLGGAL
jgi:hypothetical protein